MGDVTALPIATYPDRSFTAVLDKGTLDSLLCGEGSTTAAAKYATGVARLLGPGGVFLVVSHGSPENRLRWVGAQTIGLSRHLRLSKIVSIHFSLQLTGKGVPGMERHCAYRT